MLAHGVPDPTLRSVRPPPSRPPLALQRGELGTELLKLQAQDVRLLSDGPRLLGFVRSQRAGGLDLQQPPASGETAAAERPNQTSSGVYAWAGDVAAHWMLRSGHVSPVLAGSF